MSTSELDCARRILEICPRLSRWLAARLRDQPEPGNLTISQFRVLTYVQRHSGCSQTDVVQWRRVAAPTMSRTVDALVEKGLLERRRAPDDRRRVVLCLTPAGDSLVARVREHMERALARELASITDAQRATIVAGLTELAAVISGHGASGGRNSAFSLPSPAGSRPRSSDR